MTPEQRVAWSLARDGITLPAIVDKRPKARPGARKGPSKAQVAREKRDMNLSAARKVSARLFPKMKELQKRGWTMREISRFLKVPRKSVCWELFYNSYREIGE